LKKSKGQNVIRLIFLKCTSESRRLEEEKDDVDYDDYNELDFWKELKY